MTYDCVNKHNIFFMHNDLSICGIKVYMLFEESLKR